MNAFPKLTFVLGGAASGKSAYAESLVRQAGRNQIYLATAQAFDAEMKDKITTHRKQRGADWLTIEAPVDVAIAFAGRDARDIILLDCATLWLSNLLLEEADIPKATTAFFATVATCPCPVVVVSNEVGQGIIPDNTLSRRFRNLQGQFNKDLAATADLAVLVTAGLPMVLKGTLPA